MLARRDRRVRAGLKGVFWLVLLFALGRALWPDPFTEPYVGPLDKVVHAFAFYVLALLAATAYPGSSLLRLGATLWAFGGVIEVLQAIPVLHRDASWGDLAADLVGILAAFVPMALPGLRASLRRH